MAGIRTGLIALMGVLGLSGCMATQSAPAAAFDIASGLACTQDQLATADPSCLVLTDPRVSDSADRAIVITQALEAAGYQPIKLWAVPRAPGARVLGFAAAQNRGKCFSRRDCGNPFPYYVAPALQLPDGSLHVIDPTVLDAPTDPAAWLSQLTLGGKSLADIRMGTMDSGQTAAGLNANGDLILAPASPEIARAGLRAAYCQLPGRRAEFQGPLGLRGYDRPRRPIPGCETA